MRRSARKSIADDADLTLRVFLRYLNRRRDERVGDHMDKGEKQPLAGGHDLSAYAPARLRGDYWRLP